MTFFSRPLLLIIILLSISNLYGQLLLKRIVVNGKDKVFETTSTLQLSQKEDDLLLEFAELSNNHKKYEYSFGEIDDKVVWQKVSYPTAHFQNLKHGNYQFKMRIVDQNTATFLKISKEKSFFEEWWFYPLIIAYILALIGVGFYLFFLYDFRQKLKMQHVRNQIAADLHDEVGSNLNSIAIYTEVLRKNAKGSSTDILDKITANSKESVSLMQDTVWMINPKNDSTEKLLERMKSFASGILATKNISFDFTAPADFKKVKFSMEQRKNCYLIFKEAINNIVKHADATKVVVNISKKDNEIDIKIEDNGKGFDINELHEGNGLQNFKERAEEAEFELNVDSEIDKGTIIEMKIIA